MTYRSIARSSELFYHSDKKGAPKGRLYDVCEITFGKRYL